MMDLSTVSHKKYLGVTHMFSIGAPHGWSMQFAECMVGGPED